MTPAAAEVAEADGALGLPVRVVRPPAAGAAQPRSDQEDPERPRDGNREPHDDPEGDHGESVGPRRGRVVMRNG